MGEYPLAWAACLCNEGIYNLLLLKGADPDAQDSYGNTVLHMVVVADQLGMYGYALRHPLKSANANVRNQRALTCLTLSCELGRDECFKVCLKFPYQSLMTLQKDLWRVNGDWYGSLFLHHLCLLLSVL